MLKENLSFSENCDLLFKLAENFEASSSSNSIYTSNRKQVIIKSAQDHSDERKARTKVLADLSKPLRKVAFDTRRIDQEHQRNPRQNLQYWHRQDEFITESMQDKIQLFSKLFETLKIIKQAYGTQPEWHESYARVLHDTVERSLRLKIGDQDIYEPQLNYIQQLIFARYQLSMDELKKIGSNDLYKRILNKDESLLKRGAYINNTGFIDKTSAENKSMVINGNMTQQNIVEAIFGNNNFRRDGEKTVERTITITIRDEVKD